MVALNQAVADGVNAFARAVVRQAVESSSTGLTSTAPFSPPPTPSPTTPSLTSTVASTSAAATSTPPADNNQGNNSPLLFFVALGFGVVFTNLWIIVGVKYCFRYNARNRQMRGVDENGDPINLENMPQRPHRRRREKKLMTMDEVNEKFPMVKYKTWVSDRARDGLPTAGGVSVTPSRANSIRSVQGIVPEIAPKERESVDGRPETAATVSKSEEKGADTSVEKSNDDKQKKEGTSTSANPTNGTELTQVQTVASADPKDGDRHASDDEDDDEHINAALPPELLESPGDTCAICIDTLEDDDDVRGLTCGHAFHAVCLDPWLTNRRACCPLCKADYYTPKPRPPPAEGDAANAAAGNVDPSRNNGRMNMPRNPPRSLNPWSRRNGTRTVALGNGRFGAPRMIGTDLGADPGYGNGHFQRFERNPSSRNNSTAQGATETQDGLLSRLGRRVPRLNMPQFGRSRDTQTTETQEATASGANGGTTTTPSQLEAGTRPAGNASFN